MRGSEPGRQYSFVYSERPWANLTLRRIASSITCWRAFLTSIPTELSDKLVTKSRSEVAWVDVGVEHNCGTQLCPSLYSLKTQRRQSSHARHSSRIGRREDADTYTTNFITIVRKNIKIFFPTDELKLLDNYPIKQRSLKRWIKHFCWPLLWNS